MKRAVRKRRKSPLQTGILKAALRRARRWCEKNGLAIGTCIGCKHTEKDGYGKGRRLCVKFHVQKKQDPANSAHAVPKALPVRYKGRVYHVKTDVVEIGIPQLQAYPVLETFVNKVPFEFGCPCCVLQASGGTAKILLTAGHVFSSGPLNPGSTYTAQLNGQLVGDVWPDVSNQCPAGPLTDFAAVSIDPAPQNYPTQIQQAPWTAFDSYFPDDQTGTYPDGYPGSGALQGYIVGQYTSSLLQLDGVISQPLTVNNGQLNLAPPLYHYRFAGNGSQSGDSGSPVVLYDENNKALTNTVLGVHVAGFTDSNGVAWGWAIPMEKVMEGISANSGQHYNVVPA